MRMLRRNVIILLLLVLLSSVLAVTSVPVGVVRIMPLQHALNVVVGIFWGPWMAFLAALFTAFVRMMMDLGTVFALPGSIFGGLAVGLTFQVTGRDTAALAEPVATVLVGGIVSALVLAPRLEVEEGVLFFIYILAVSSIPGSLFGYGVVRVLRYTGIPDLLDRWFSRAGDV